MELYFGLKGLGFDQKFYMLATVLNSFGILLFKEGYERIAVKLTDAENWMTDTVYADKLISRLSVFNFVNSYFSLFFTIFFYCWAFGNEGKENKGPCRMGAYRKLQQDLGILLATQIFAQNITNFIVPYILLIVKMRTEGGLERDENGVARAHGGRGHAACDAGGGATQCPQSCRGA